MKKLVRCVSPLVLVSAWACTTHENDYPRSVSFAFADHASAKLGRTFEVAEKAHPGESGAEVIRYGRRAFEARLALIDLAEQSLDLQYYIWDDDVTGRMLAERLYRAAERGVRVRLLLDDNSVVGRDSEIARFSGHPRIEIRAFNPFRHRDQRVADLFTDPSRVNRRSHNKVLIADNAIAVIGGRNIADHYFGVHGESNYRDLDAVVVGPVVREASRVFDDFWNSDFAVPYEAFVETTPTPESAREQFARLAARIEADPKPYTLEADVPALAASVDRLEDLLVWGRARVLYDDPSKVEDADVRGISGELEALASGAQEEILIENAYFVPRERLVQVATAAVRRGVRVRVLTNSLASNDVVAVHAGYEKYRDELIEGGVEIYELRPDSAMKERWSVLSTESRAGLHAKTMVIDRRYTVIGSFNLDPRSADINTELVVLVDSPEFAERVGEYLDDGVRPENSYRVTLEHGDLRWRTRTSTGEEVVYEKEPETTRWQRFVTGLIGVLPIQSQL